jgi:hypothetical protein
MGRCKRPSTAVVDAKHVQLAASPSLIEDPQRRERPGTGARATWQCNLRPVEGASLELNEKALKTCLDAVGGLGLRWRR